MIQRWYQSSLLLCLGMMSTALAGSSLMDAAGNLRLNSLPESEGAVVAFVASPGTPSGLVSATSDLLSYEAGTLVCRGATLSDDNTLALATSSLVAGAIVLDGISVGDLEAGLRDSRHGRTLSAIFRARTNPVGGDEQQLASKQTLVIPVNAEELPLAEEKIASDVTSLFVAAALESGSSASFKDLYDLKIVTYTDSSEIRSMAAAEAASKETTEPLSTALTNAYKKAKSLSSVGLDSSPLIAEGLVKVGNVYSKQSLSVRAKLASWKARVARGLLVDGFGSEAEALLERVYSTFDSETIMAAGMPVVSVYRREQRAKVQVLLESGIQDIFDGQIENLGKTTLKRLNAQLLKTVNDPAESVMDSNAASLRNEAFAFEAAADDLEVPTLALTKTKAVREMAAKLNDAVMSFPDSAAAKIKRTRMVKKVVKKDKKPGQGIVDLGLDLVAVLRPDGFGSLQGFAGYQLGGNSITFGVHNDADDPQTIAQFGGVRPPLLRVQPKIRMDIEL
mmetsp:Transcript_7278/g.9498  ORF Transcript_7278/g.9498 Transcript_7278/m.9498 type:complete len:507 (+) Transcript_7278:115-1635(+)|eukprot:CAMPEP_0198146602 /NCGR_PEP_ID=MMETSP1443-20131203/30192_1 /TAXON_ID=186043 /ORGANISM="Entomoneis sp., Strain CCMP2396" /LENGTH=506 /DNA_ID=CAMNT_0043810619 /DNA_START=80 /DNA_END=1600 /DNA_ORIENTATION=+